MTTFQLIETRDPDRWLLIEVTSNRTARYIDEGRLERLIDRKDQLLREIEWDTWVG